MGTDTGAATAAPDLNALAEEIQGELAAIDEDNRSALICGAVVFCPRNIRAFCFDPRRIRCSISVTPLASAAKAVACCWIDCRNFISIS